jgi:aryl-alcohol dehydrogenase-like predicted oxidoreductase
MCRCRSALRVLPDADAGPGVFGPPPDPDAVRAVLRRAVELGVDHIDTSQYYGPEIVNELIRDALHPYPQTLKLVTKVGARRDDSGAWLEALSPAELRSGVEDNLRTLQVERMDLVNLRLEDAQDAEGRLAWLLHHSERILLIPGTRSVKHLEENIAAGGIELDEQDMRRLDAATQLGNPAAPAE